jgi:hypothetical protein
MNSVEPAGSAIIPPPQSVAQSPLFRERFIFILLQIGHRIGAISLFAFLATWGMIYMSRDFHWPLVISFGSAGVGLCSALIALMITPVHSAHRREARGVAVFNLVLFAVTLNFILLAQLDQIRPAASEFFTPNRSIGVSPMKH